jgi:hypothetical protein
MCPSCAHKTGIPYLFDRTPVCALLPQNIRKASPKFCIHCCASAGADCSTTQAIASVRMAARRRGAEGCARLKPNGGCNLHQPAFLQVITDEVVLLKRALSMGVLPPDSNGSGDTAAADGSDHSSAGAFDAEARSKARSVHGRTGGMRGSADVGVVSQQMPAPILTPGYARLCTRTRTGTCVRTPHALPPARTGCTLQHLQYRTVPPRSVAVLRMCSRPPARLHTQGDSASDPSSDDGEGSTSSGSPSWPFRFTPAPRVPLEYRTVHSSGLDA